MMNGAKMTKRSAAPVDSSMKPQGGSVNDSTTRSATGKGGNSPGPGPRAA